MLGEAKICKKCRCMAFHTADSTDEERHKTMMDKASYGKLKLQIDTGYI